MAHVERPPASERSLPELFSDMTSELGLLVRKEIELAQTEVREEVSHLGQGLGLFAATAAVGFVALVLIAFAAAWGLSELVPEGVAFLVVGVVFVVVAVALLSKAKAQLKQFSPVPQRTVETVKEAFSGQDS
jgi:predicted RND superfamily exporter protein